MGSSPTRPTKRRPEIRSDLSKCVFGGLWVEVSPNGFRPVDVTSVNEWGVSGSWGCDLRGCCGCWCGEVCWGRAQGTLRGHEVLETTVRVDGGRGPGFRHTRPYTVDEGGLGCLLELRRGPPGAAPQRGSSWQLTGAMEPGSDPQS
ncbi:hypothetical protein GCM10023347_38380 [Streptomyces chumphonensis]